MAEKVFANGFSFKRNEKAPDFVIGRMSVKVDDAIEFLNKHSENGWVNINVNKARSGSYYVELDTWKPTEKQGRELPPQKEEEIEDVPF